MKRRSKVKLRPLYCNAIARLIFSCFFILFTLGLPTKIFASVVQPTFSTLPLSDNMISTVGQAGEVKGEEGYNYVQINNSQTSSSGAVWFKQPINFQTDFSLTMAIYIENTANDSDGIAFVMQSQGLSALADQTGPTLGVWADTEEINRLEKGAIQNGFAIEFDTFYNNSWAGGDKQMDKDLSDSHHIAWAYSGKSASYYSAGGLLRADKVLNHNDVAYVNNLSDGQWHEFTVQYTAITQQLRYIVADFGVDTALKFDENFMSDPEIFNNAPVYFGFTASNGGYAQEKAISFIDVKGLIDLDLSIKTSVESNTLTDSHTQTITPQIVSTDQTIDYSTTIEYKGSSSITELEKGSEVSIELPKELSVVDNQVLISGEEQKYNREENSLLISLPAIEAGNTYNITFSAKYEEISLNQNVSKNVPVAAVWRGNVYSNEAVAGNTSYFNNYYSIVESWPPTISNQGLYNSLEDSEINSVEYRQKRNIYLDIQINDENSTSVALYTSGLLTRGEARDYQINPSLDEVLTTQERVDLEHTFDNFIYEYDTSDLPIANYTIVFYAVDQEGNNSDIYYVCVDFKGIATLDEVPNLGFETLTLNEIYRLKDESGYIYFKYDGHSFDTSELTTEGASNNQKISVTNTSEGTWQLEAVLGDFLEVGTGNLGIKKQGTEILFMTPGTMIPGLTISSESQVIAKQNSSGIPNLSADLQTADIYLRVKVTDTLISGTFQAPLRWTLENSISY